MNADLQELQTQAGAAISAAGVPDSYGSETDLAAWTAALEGVGLCDRSHWGLLAVSGMDCQQFLHNQTTNDIKSLAPGQSAIAAIVNSTARALDLATIHLLAPDLAWVVLAPGQADTIATWFDRYIFPADRVAVADLGPEMAHYSLLGPQSEGLLGLRPPETPTHWEDTVAGIPVRVAVGTDLNLPGYSLFVARDRAAELWQTLQSAGATPLGTRVWEQLRLRQGRPYPGRELTDAYNPLEAGLWSAVSLDKGCYIGQETIARLHTYKGVKQRLWGLRSSTPLPTSPATIFDDAGNKIGTLTSTGTGPEGEMGLAYIRTQAGGEDLKVCFEDGSTAIAVAVPFLSHTYP